MRDYLLRQFELGDLTMVVKHYEYSGGERADTPAVASFVLVHGIGASSRYFARLARELRRHGNVYAVDMPGFGIAPKPQAPLSIEDFAVLLRAFTAAWSMTDPVLVGHSMGTQIVAEMAIQDPGLTSSLVLIGPVVDPEAPTAVQQGLRLLHDLLIEPPSANWVVVTAYARCGPRWYLAELPAMLDYHIEDRLPFLAPATLVIRGAHDPVAPTGWAQSMALAIPNSVRFDVPRAAHVAQHRAPATCAAAIVAHWRANAPAVVAAASDAAIEPEL